MTNAILLDDKDNVATCTAAAKAGDMIQVLGGGSVRCVEDIPIWHKVALKDIAKGDKVFKYGEIIGEAAADIAKGAWVSHENIFSVPRDYESEMIK
ncbi:MAG: UxaA family hydrolase [Selenomonadaceae bacterium]|nr:UxaA family hydrolase [Selenomonadaceae bacterium]